MRQRDPSLLVFRVWLYGAPQRDIRAADFDTAWLMARVRHRDRPTGEYPNAEQLQVYRAGGPGAVRRVRQSGTAGGSSAGSV